MVRRCAGSRYLVNEEALDYWGWGWGCCAKWRKESLF